VGVIASRGDVLLVFEFAVGGAGGDKYVDNEEVDEEEEAGVCDAGWDWEVGSGAVTPGTAAFLRNVVILSLYASFSFEMSPL